MNNRSEPTGIILKLQKGAHISCWLLGTYISIQSNQCGTNNNGISLLQWFKVSATNMIDSFNYSNSRTFLIAMESWRFDDGSISTRSTRDSSCSRTSRARFIERCWMKFSKHHCVEKPVSTHWTYSRVKSSTTGTYTHTLCWVHSMSDATKPKGQNQNFGFRDFSQNRSCLIETVNMWAILTKL